MHFLDSHQLYNLHELQYAAIAPLRAMARMGKEAHRMPFSPLSYTHYGRSMAATFELIERITNRYGKPTFDIHSVNVGGRNVKVEEERLARKPFGKLIHFKKRVREKQPKMLVVAPMSGHHATLLRGTVTDLLPHMDVYITDWKDARYVPAGKGEFRLETYIQYVIEFIKEVGPDVHLMAVCQPAVPVLAAAAILNEYDKKNAPLSMTLIGGPIDSRKSPTKVNELAKQRSLNWFERNVITTVPFNYPGFGRKVYPGFLQLTGFMSMNLERHVGEHMKLFKHLIQGDGDSAESHKKFYDEYLAVADLPAEFYLDCIDQVFQQHLLPRGKMKYQGKTVRPEAITKTALLTLEGELDDISGVGQTRAAHDICTGLPASKRQDYMQKGVGHYGIFNGRKYREFVVPIINEFVKKHDK